jgi:hypothetical protein
MSSTQKEILRIPHSPKRDFKNSTSLIEILNKILNIKKVAAQEATKPKVQCKTAFKASIIMYNKKLIKVLGQLSDSIHA